MEQSFINDYSVRAFYKVFSFGVFIESNEFLKKNSFKEIREGYSLHNVSSGLVREMVGEGSKKVR